MRGTVRSPKPWLDEMFRERFGRDSYESVILANFEDVDTLAKFMDGVSGVAHVVCVLLIGMGLEDESACTNEVLGYVGIRCHFQLESGRGRTVGSESYS